MYDLTVLPPRFANLAGDLRPEDLMIEPDGETYGWWGLHYAPPEPEKPEPKIAARRFPGGLVPYVRSRMEPVFLAHAPKKKEVVERLDLHLAPGSYGTAIVQLYALRGCRAVRLALEGGGEKTAGEPRGIARWMIYSLSSGRPGFLVQPPAESAGAAEANAAAARAYAEKLAAQIMELEAKKDAGTLSVQEATTLARKRTSQRYNPLHVANVSGDIAKGATQEVWAMFYVPEEAPLGGCFTRQLRILPQNAPPTTIPVTIHVEPFRLVPAKLTCGFWYNGLQPPGTRMPPDPGTEAQREGHDFETDAFDLRAMGLNAVGFAKIRVPYAHTDGLDLRPFEEAMARLQKAGFGRQGAPLSCWYNYSWAAFDSGHLMHEKLSPDRLVETMAALDELAEKHPEWPEIIVCFTDELGWEEVNRLRVQNEDFFRQHPEAWPQDGRRLTEAAAVARRVKEAGLKHVSLAFIANRKQATEMLLPVCGAGYANLGAFSQETCEKARELGCKFYTYNTWRSRMAFGYYNWKCSRHGARGNLQWGYGVHWSLGEPFVIHLPGGKVLRHRLYYQMAEGVEDLRYLNTLEEKIAAAPESKAAKKGQELLDEIAAKLEVNWGYGAKAHDSPNFWRGEMADAYDGYRRRLGEAIAAFGE